MQCWHDSYWLQQPSRSKTQPLKTSSSRLRKMLQKNLSVPNCILKMGEVMFNSEREKNIYSTDFATKQRLLFLSLIFQQTVSFRNWPWFSTISWRILFFANLLLIINHSKRLFKVIELEKPWTVVSSLNTYVQRKTNLQKSFQCENKVPSVHGFDGFW